jgi:hypothetical protein
MERSAAQTNHREPGIGQPEARWDFRGHDAVGAVDTESDERNVGECVEKLGDVASVRIVLLTPETLSDVPSA